MTPWPWLPGATVLGKSSQFAFSWLLKQSRSVTSLQKVWGNGDKGAEGDPAIWNDQEGGAADSLQPHPGGAHRDPPLFTRSASSASPEPERSTVALTGERPAVVTIAPQKPGPRLQNL